MTGEVPTRDLWDTIDEASIISAINCSLETKITYEDVKKHYDVIREADVKEWRVGDKCWRIITQRLPNPDYKVHDYDISMYLLDFESRPYIYDYILTDEMAIDKLHFFVRINIADNTWYIDDSLI